MKQEELNIYKPLVTASFDMDRIYDSVLYIVTLESNMKATKVDYIIRGID